jgi:hypothetical protein
MEHTTDRDGKSKTASAVDQEHYPEQNEVANPHVHTGQAPTHAQISQRAYDLWMAKGCPHGTADQDWAEAEAESDTPRKAGGLMSWAASKAVGLLV